MTQTLPFNFFYDGVNLYKADYCTAAKDSQALVFPNKETHIVQELALYNRAETKIGHVWKKLIYFFNLIIRRTTNQPNKSSLYVTS